jgi:hypothetical protein
MSECSLRQAVRCAAVLLLAQLWACGHPLGVSIDGRVLTEDGKIIRGGTVAVIESRGPVGTMPTERVLDLVGTDRDGVFHSRISGVRGPLLVELIHEHCDWYSSIYLITPDELKKASRLEITIRTKREICPDWMQPFAGQ